MPTWSIALIDVEYRFSVASRVGFPPMSQNFGSGLQPVEIPHSDHHSFSGSASTTPTFSPANKPTPLVGRWADYGWDRTAGEPTSATLPETEAREPKGKGSTPLLPSTVSAFDDRHSPLAANGTGTEEYISNLLSETAKLGDEGDDCPAPRSSTPPPPAASAQVEIPRTSTYGRSAPPAQPRAFSPKLYQVTGGYQPQNAQQDRYAPPPPAAPYSEGAYWVPPQPHTTYGGHLMPSLHPAAGGSNVSKFTPPPPPTVVFATELGSPDSDTPAHEVGAILFHQGQRWVQKMQIWLAAHPRERPSAPCPAPEHYTTIEAWLDKLGVWYQANFHSRKAARPVRARPTTGTRNQGRGRGAQDFAPNDEMVVSSVQYSAH